MCIDKSNFFEISKSEYFEIPVLAQAFVLCLGSFQIQINCCSLVINVLFIFLDDFENGVRQVFVLDPLH